MYIYNDCQEKYGPYISLTTVGRLGRYILLKLSQRVLCSTRSSHPNTWCKPRGSIWERESHILYIQQQENNGTWRRGRDLNPRYPFRYGRFRGGSFQPLTHLSAPFYVVCSLFYQDKPTASPQERSRRQVNRMKYSLSSVILSQPDRRRTGGPPSCAAFAQIGVVGGRVPAMHLRICEHPLYEFFNEAFDQAIVRQALSNTIHLRSLRQRISASTSLRRGFSPEFYSSAS